MITKEYLKNFYEGRRVLVTGSGGFLGKHVVFLLRRLGADVCTISSDGYDLRQRDEAENIFGIYRGVTDVIHLAAKVSGIEGNSNYPLEHLTDNLLINTNIVLAAMENGVERFVAAGSVCGYPGHTTIPFNEQNYFNGSPELSNRSYGESKRILLRLLQAASIQYPDLKWAYLICTNLYGIGDHFDSGPRSHVIPDLVSRFYWATRLKESTISLWGTGKPTRDFLWVEDAAFAYTTLLPYIDLHGFIVANAGSGQETSILWLAKKLQELSGYKGKVIWNTSKPDGQMRRAMQTSMMDFDVGWSAEMNIKDGIAHVYDWYSKYASELESRPDG